MHRAEPADTAAAASALAPIGDGDPRVDDASRQVSISVEGGAPLLLAAVRALDEAGVRLEDIALHRPTLDEVFLALTGEGLPDEASDSRPTPRRPQRAA